MMKSIPGKEERDDGDYSADLTETEVEDTDEVVVLVLGKQQQQQQVPFSVQSMVLFTIVCLDLFILAHMLDSHNGITSAYRPAADEEFVVGEKMYFMWGYKFYISMPHRQATILHASIGTLPLLLSLHQLSFSLRKGNMERHRMIGKLLVLCGLAQIPTTAYLGIFWAQQEIVNLMRVLFVIFAFLWGIWAAIVYYTAAISKNMRQHAQWGVRFTIMCHFVPVFGRLLTIAIWSLHGQPMDYPGRIKALQHTIWSLLVLFFPLQEFAVWLETGDCWFFPLAKKAKAL